MRGSSIKVTTRQPLGTRAEVAAYLGVPVSTLNYWALRKVGPPYRLVGRSARYAWSDVETWLKSQETGGAA